jgi:hypothetical protein
VVFIFSLPDISVFVTIKPDISLDDLELVTQYSGWDFGTRINPGHEQLSLLISFNLPSIPPPTTALPFPYLGIGALLHPR